MLTPNPPCDTFTFTGNVQDKRLKDLDSDTVKTMKKNLNNEQITKLLNCLEPIWDEIDDYSIEEISPDNIDYLEKADKNKVFDLANIIDNDIEESINLIRGQGDISLNEDYFDEINDFLVGTQSEKTKKALQQFEEETGVTLYLDHNLPDDNIDAVKDFVNITKANGHKSANTMYITDYLPENTSGLYDGEGAFFSKPIVDKNGNFSSYEFNTLFHENIHKSDKAKNGDRNEDYFSSHELEKQIVAEKISEYAAKDVKEFVAEVGSAIHTGRIQFTKDEKGHSVFRAYNTIEGDDAYFVNLKEREVKPITKDELKTIMSLYYKFNGPKFKTSAPQIMNPEYTSCVEVREKEIRAALV